MVVALGLLLVALAVVIIRDRDFWFPPTPEPVADELGGEESSASQAKSTKPARPASTKPKSKAVTTAAQTAKAAAPLISAERRALPPLQVEVVAGDGRHTVQAGTNAVHVDLHTRTPGRVIEDERVAAQVTSTPPVNASERVRLSPETEQAVTRPVTPEYPLLARQMKVQGSVILEALIGRDGTIQELKVVSGPAILAEAAREAVKQWRFKPYMQSGKAVETQARITVNFTISTT
jgi:protein TonB